MIAIFNYTTGVTPARIVVYIMTALLIFAVFYKGFGRKMETVDDYIHRASSWSKLLAAKSKAISIYKKALELPDITKEKEADIYLYIGNEYYKKKDFVHALEYFEKMKYRLKNPKLSFHPAYMSMVLCYHKMKQKDEAMKIYRNLEARYTHDPRFGVVTSLFNKISR